MVNIDSLVRDNIKQLKPYTSARDEFKGQADIFLDANENAYGTPLQQARFNRYPDPYQWRLKEKIGAWLKIDPQWMFLGNGSDEAIDLLLRVFGQPGRDAVMIMPPTYGMYTVSAQINDLQIVEAPLTPEFKIDRTVIKEKANERIKLLFVCSPNNPTGQAFAQNDIEWLAQHFKGIVIVDEAYIDFAPQKSALPLIGDFQNLVVLRTFSKAWGSAAIRLGMAFANPQIINWLNKIKMPYNVSGLTQEAALKLLNNARQKEQYVKKIIEQRGWLAGELQKLSVVQQVFPSDANFLLARFKDANRIYRYLMEKGIIVRNRSNQLHCENCLRITVGTEEENEKLINILRELG